MKNHQEVKIRRGSSDIVFSQYFLRHQHLERVAVPTHQSTHHNLHYADIGLSVSVLSRKKIPYFQSLDYLLFNEKYNAL